MIHRNLIYNLEKMTEGALVTGITPSYVYVNGRKTEEIDGVRLRVVLPACNFDALYVKVRGLMHLELPDNQPTPAKFVNLQLRLYVLNGEIGIAATADAVEWDDRHTHAMTTK